MTPVVKPFDTFVKVAGSNSDAKAGTVSLMLEPALGGVHIEVQFALECVPIALTALCAEAGRIAHTLSDEHISRFQVLRTTGFHLGISGSGLPTITYSLEGGAELTFELGGLESLRDEIDAAIKRRDKRFQN